MTESQHTEWKESWRDDWLRTVCGFANAEGGVLVIGRNDDGDVVGVAGAQQLLVELPNKIRDLLGVIAEVNLHVEHGLEYIEIVTPPYPNPISYRGHYYQRSGSTLQELKGAALDRFLLGRYGRTWDGTALPGLSLADLSPDALARFRALAERSGRLDAEALAESDAGLIDKLKLTEGSYLKRAAALLFHADPVRFASGAFVKLGYFRSESDLAYHDEITGDLFEQVREVQDLLFTKYLKAAITYDDLVRIERFPVPREAMREALLNALVHRDYAVAAPVLIRVYDDRLVIVNPAVLPDGWTQASLLATHNSHPFNPDVANAFFRAGEIEAWGRGVQRIFDVCRHEGTPEPSLRFESNALWIEFPFSAAYLSAIRGGATGGGAPHVTDPVTDPVADPVDSLLIVIGSKALAPSEIQRRLGLKHRPTFRANYLRPALSLGLIEMSIPDKPSSRLQTYRLTTSGSQRLASIEAQRKAP